MVNDSNTSVDKQGSAAQGGDSGLDAVPFKVGENIEERQDAAQKFIEVAKRWICYEAWPKIKKIGGSSNFWTAVATVMIAITTGIYTYYARKQWEAMDKQATLMHEQLVGTEAAVLVVSEYPGIELPAYGFDIGLRNDGHVIASKVRVTLTAKRETVSTTEAIGEPWHCDFDLPPIAQGKVGEHQCFLQGLNERSWQPIGAFQQTIAVDGGFSYWNGFEDVPIQSVCLRYVPSGLKSKFGSEGPGSFVSCDRYPGWIQYLKERMAGNGEAQPPPLQ